MTKQIIQKVKQVKFETFKILESKISLKIKFNKNKKLSSDYA